MAFTKRIWLPHDVQYPGRKILLQTGNPNEYDFNRSEGIVNAAGDLLSAENLNELETRISNEFLNKLDSSIISSGTWTPYFRGIAAAGTPTYTVQSGIWHRIGKLVLLHFSIAISSKGGMSGIIALSGLPFILATPGFGTSGTTTGLTAPTGFVIADPFVTSDGIILRLSGTDHFSLVVDTEISDALTLVDWNAEYFTI